MTSFGCCLPLSRVNQRRVKNGESPVSSAASESALNDSTYDKLFGDPNAHFASVLANPGSATHSISDPFTNISLSGPDHQNENLNPDNNRNLSSLYEQTTDGREHVTRDFLAHEILKLRHALEVTRSQLALTEQEMKVVLIELARHKEVVKLLSSHPTVEQGLFRQFFSTTRPKRKLTKDKRRESCPTALAGLPPHTVYSDKNQFSTINRIIEPPPSVTS